MHLPLIALTRTLTRGLRTATRLGGRLAGRLAAGGAMALFAGGVTALLSGAAWAATLSFGVLQLNDDPRYAEDRLYARPLAQPGGRPDAGLDTALKEARFVAASMNVSFALERANADDAAGLLRELDRLHKRGVRLFVIDAPGPVVAQVAAGVRGKDLLLFNVSAADDDLRQANCQANLLHTLPSHAMRADALAQFLVAQKWRQVLVLQGPLADDALLADAFARAARRFGLKIVETRRFVLSNDPRQRDQGNVALLTAGSDYDVVLVADSVGEFARTVPYQTVKPRPVVGSEGLTATAWHWAWERHGAPQLNARFEKQAGRRMSEPDWAAWLAGKAVVEAMQRTNSAEFARISAYLRGPDITLDGFKGNRLSFRPWDNQLRQPLLIATHNAVVERAPIEGFLHQHNKLDTLGFDAPDSRCKLR